MENIIKILSVSLILQSCSGSGGSSGGVTASNPTVIAPSQSVFNTMADGVFNPLNTNCINQNNEHFKIILIKTNGEFSVLKTLFDDVMCSGDSQVISLASVYIFVSAKVNPLNDGSDLTDVSLIDSQIAILNPSYVSDFNSQNLYGYNNWILGNAKSIIDRSRLSGESPIFTSGTLMSFSFKLIGNSSLIFNGVQYNKQ